MTVSSTTRKAGPYLCDGVDDEFAFSFKVFAETDVRVVLTDADDEDTELVLNTDFTVALNVDQNASPGGTVTTLTAYAAGYKVNILSQVSALQSTQIPNKGGFYSKVVEAAFDKVTILIQQLAERVDRALVQPVGSAIENLPFPAPTAGKVLGWDEAGTALRNYDPGSVALATPGDVTVTAGKMSASTTDILFGRSTAGAGEGEEIACTAAGRALLDDADASAQRTTLGATATGGALFTAVDAAAARTAIGATATGSAVITAADAAAVRTAAGLGSLATQSAVTWDQLPDGTLVGFSSDFDAARTDVAAGAITQFPPDGSTPLITEGADCGLSVSHTAKSNTNKLKISLSLNAMAPSAAEVAVALFAGNTCIAVATFGSGSGTMSGGWSSGVVYTPASTSPITYTARVSTNTGSVLLNQTTLGTDYGATHGSTLTIEEIKAS